MRLSQLVSLLAVCVAFSGCPKKIESVPQTGESTPPPQASTNTLPSQQTQGATNTGNTQAQLQELQRLGMVIYFDYDKSDIRSEFVPVLAAHAKFLNGDNKQSVRLEGHTDERGSREYNIGLGERRAQTVRRALMLQGVPEGQITTISYGEERPAASGGDEEVYGKNRRVEMSYGKQ
jgi:peptidoglycan-associated lipoprotein